MDDDGGNQALCQFINRYTIPTDSAVYLSGGIFSLIDCVGIGELRTLNASGYATILAVNDS